MIKECFRILKPSGKIRIVTPGLDKMLLSCSDSNNEIFKKYTERLVQKTFKSEIDTHFEYVLNYNTYNYFHKFIHSQHTLSRLLTSNNFKGIKSCKMHESDDGNLRNLEIHAKWLGEDLYDFESIYIEAEK